MNIAMLPPCRRDERHCHGATTAPLRLLLRALFILRQRLRDSGEDAMTLRAMPRRHYVARTPTARCLFNIINIAAARAAFIIVHAFI